MLAGDGPERERLAARLGEHATFLGWRHGTELARVYASADAFLFPSATDTFGQVILEAQASGLPVVAVAEGGPLSLIEDRITGRLCPADGASLAAALLEVVAHATAARADHDGGAAVGPRTHLGVDDGAARRRLSARPIGRAERRRQRGRCGARGLK